METRLKKALLFVGAAVLLTLMWYFKNIVGYIFISAVISWIGRPLVRWISSRKIGSYKIPDTLSAVITLILFWAIFVGLFSFFIPLFANEAQELSNINYKAVLDYLEEPLGKFLIGTELLSDGLGTPPQEILKEEILSVLKGVNVGALFGSLAGHVGGLILLLFSVTFISFFFLKEEDMFANLILLFVPSGYEDRVVRVINSTNNLLKRYFIGILLEVMGVMILDSIGFTLAGMGLNHAVVCALFAGLMNVIPYIGPWIGGAFAIVVAIATNLNANFSEVTLPLILFILLVVVIVQMIDNYLFQPLIYSSSVKAHPLEIFVVIIMAGSVGGIIWMILAIPVYTIGRVIAKEFLNEWRFIQKITKNIE